jgi:ABC-type nickel/cobalt efflux system permease component RcnA
MELRAVMRALCGPGHVMNDDHEHDHDEDPAAEDAHAEDATKWLRIVAVFVILVSGLAGGLPPLFSKVSACSVLVMNDLGGNVGCGEGPRTKQV